MKDPRCAKGKKKSKTNTR